MSVSPVRLALAALLVLVVGTGAGVAGSGLAKNSVGAKQIRTNAVRSPEIAANAVKGADIAENTLASVPNSLAVGGVAVLPVSVSVGDSATAIVTSGSGYSVTLGCSAGQTQVSVTRSAPNPVITFTWNASNQTQTQSVVATASIGSTVVGAEVTVLGHDGSGTVVRGTAARASDYVGTDDCMFVGTIQKIP